MGKTTKCAVGLAVVLLCSLLTAPAARATLIDYTFTGACVDCVVSGSQTVADLVVDGYVNGDPLSLTSVLSFTYTSDVFSSGLTFSNFTAVAGVLQSSGAPLQDFSITGDATDGVVTYQGMQYTMSMLGDWALISGTILDHGDHGDECDDGCKKQRSVPEPSTFLLLASGLVGLGTVIRRR